MDDEAERKVRGYQTRLGHPIESEEPQISYLANASLLCILSFFPWTLIAKFVYLLPIFYGSDFVKHGVFFGPVIASDILGIIARWKINASRGKLVGKGRASFGIWLTFLAIVAFIFLIFTHD